MLVTKTTSSNLNYFVRPTVQSSKIFINSVHNTAKNSKFLDLRRRFLTFLLCIVLVNIWCMIETLTG